MAAIVSIMVLIVQSIPIGRKHLVLNFSSYRVFWDGLDVIDDYGDNCEAFTVDQMLPVIYSHYSLPSVYMWLAIDTVLYLVIYNYFVCIFPGKYGHAKSYLFPLEYMLKGLKKLCEKKMRFIAHTSVHKGI